MLLLHVGPSDCCRILRISLSLPSHPLCPWDLCYYCGIGRRLSPSSTLLSSVYLLLSQTFNRLKVSASPTTSCFFQGDDNFCTLFLPSALFLALPTSHPFNIHSSLQLAHTDWKFILLAAYSTIFPYLAHHLPLILRIFSTLYTSWTATQSFTVFHNLTTQ